MDSARAEKLGAANQPPPECARRSRRQGGESGYALLLVLLMAAIIAISLYSEIPRVAFQSQRHKEQLLMERGQQYIRAIQVYTQVNKGAWPRNLDDIETYQNRHFLRHHYIDPMTGKDEWRLIHVQGNMLTDSLVTQNPSQQKQEASTQGNYVSDYGGVGQTLVAEDTQKPQDRRRPSEGGGGAAAGAAGGGLLPMNPVASDQSGGAPADPNAPAGSGIAQNPSGNPSAAGGQPGQPGQPGAPGASGAPGAPALGAGGIGYNPAAADASLSFPQPSANQPTVGAPGLPAGASNPALNMINRILTGPSPQTSGTMGSAFSSSPTTLGGGLAGVASKAVDEGIMVYNDQTLYKKWEFVFDPTKVAPLGGARTSGTPGLPVSQMSLSTPSISAPAGGNPGINSPNSLGGAFGGSISGNASMGAAGGSMSPISGFGSSGGMAASGGFGSSGGIGSGSSFGLGSTPGGAMSGTPGTPAGQTGGAAPSTLPLGYRPGAP
ncbi:MAG TPA: hypothetical protein VMU19_11900 [Bryobacteraceae bacterium]|nr:hypothetical protein [Bryobacteraceae bacterium]